MDTAGTVVQARAALTLPHHEGWKKRNGKTAAGEGPCSVLLKPQNSTKPKAVVMVVEIVLSPRFRQLAVGTASAGNDRMTNGKSGWEKRVAKALLAVGGFWAERNIIGKT